MKTTHKSGRPRAARLEWPLRRVVESVLILLTALAALAVPVVPAAAQVPADAIFSGFEPSGDFVFDLDGKTLEHAEIYSSERAAAYLVMAPELSSPLLINLRTQSVESVHLMKVAKRDDGTVDILSDATIDVVDHFTVDAENQVLSFKVKGKPSALKPKPFLLGLHKADELKSYKPEYARSAAEYQPAAAGLQALRGTSREVRVRVYFGSWCPACKRLVPRILRVADEIRGSKINFEFYGLPRPLTDDPEAERAEVHGVPTAIVYVGGKETGRLYGNDWNAPEASLNKILSGS